ncbi:MAG TPA: hypothetical protein VHN20_13750 [Beijerinckiaceae bacterium]|nr:hypothetical protein [Beijerinckiaceae bacterium]
MVDKRSAHRTSARREARRLARQCRRFPVCTLLLGSLVLLGVASAVTSIMAMSPVNGIP